MAVEKHILFIQRALSSTLLVMNVFILSGLFISSYRHRDNNYSIRADQYSVSSITESEFQQLPHTTQIYWAQDGDSAKYRQVIIHNSFVSWHRNTAVIILLPFSLLALALSWAAFRPHRLAMPNLAPESVAPMRRRHRFWLLLPTIPVIWLDYLTTLSRQPDMYWGGDYSSLNERQPILAYFLSIHPLAFVAFGIAWTCFTGTLMFVLPRTPAMTIAFYLALSHLWGLWTWGINLPMPGLFMLSAQLLTGTLLAVACARVVSAEVTVVDATANGRDAA